MIGGHDTIVTLSALYGDMVWVGGFDAFLAVSIMALACGAVGPVVCIAGVIVGIGVVCAMQKLAGLSREPALRELTAMRRSQSRLAFTVNAVRAALLLSLIVLRWTMRLVPRGAYFAIWLYGWGESVVDLSIDLSYLALDVYRDIVFLHSLAVTFCQWAVVFYSTMARLCTFSTWTYMVLANALRAAADFLINVPANIRHSLLAATAFYGDLMYTHSGDVEDCQAAFDWWVADVKDALPECLVDAFEGLRRFDCAWLAWATRIVTCFFCQLLKTIVFMSLSCAPSNCAQLPSSGARNHVPWQPLLSRGSSRVLTG
ncbi:hypothetical protein BV22DRAFT_1133917 [Leucogyrophana mollusca]|uniref:Uncharacterized protein n=1 Tax=Leucogyrophana mollusca TaxID=85980 RepID=A0ACB8B3K3_9AGAM|nr:hypothetical protein BV22DRAFT_1133917 [Leucogyrophana mollusca]